MKVSELITQLQQLADEHEEDFEISVRDTTGGLSDVEQVSVWNQRHCGSFIVIDGSFQQLEDKS